MLLQFLLLFLFVHFLFLANSGVDASQVTTNHTLFFFYPKDPLHDDMTWANNI